MKKIIAGLILLIVVQSAYSFDWIVPIMKINMSYNLSDSLELMVDDTTFMVVDYYPEGSVNFDVTVGAELFQYTWIEGQFITTMMITDANPMGGMFYPYNMEYGFRAGLQFAGLRIGYEHWCYHPVSVYDDARFAQKYGGYDHIFIEFDLQRLNR